MKQNIGNKILLSLIIGLTVSLFFCLSPEAQALTPRRCSDPEAPWNIAEGIMPNAFRCRNDVSSDDREDLLIFTFIIPGKFTCAGDQNCTKGRFCNCVRIDDCTTLYGSQNYRCVDFNRGELRRADYDCKPYHCHGKNNIVCCRLKALNEAPSLPAILDEPDVSDLPTIPDEPALPDTNPTLVPNFSLTGCCQQIVPPLDLAVYDYGVNHLVQVAINVYKCILCIIGSLMLLMIVLGGAIMILAVGNKTRIEAGKKMIIAAVIGGFVVVASVLIVNFFIKSLGAKVEDENLKINIRSTEMRMVSKDLKGVYN
ncbi:hypothetical protein COT94_02295 [Candidatus Falkowbacteria bacterium CG10_big_fil_rev_8_21_14_0_10_37_14]|uniref:Uncharacterized protein n=1 Tax=Candidatus Falkowbacteria bacterium CG10_big_fil_rev_8_21_14_0_10_37_14 TaxID=1974561 RepID=A0A2M6WTJ7_9BACT|nr:hypothetical protein [Candidatus Falkowbacteria bacterium]OIO47711.1 MAG: hypothetical protein AUJ28_00595 [Parcubacteria group bacterium CG1_02_37_51]PIT96071.1 MAG: hypothetical protein COT94_02295 [Candidatus Falkowbacteria bacterium CG10_big_fil_rev_8_21_14_0_10_37_14]